MNLPDLSLGEFELVYNMLSSTPKQNRYGFCFRATCDERHVRFSDFPFLYLSCLAKVFTSEVIDIGNNSATCGF